MNAVANPNRRPWIDEPRCGDCHGSQFAENPGKLFRQSTGHGGLYCEACHNSSHAILPSTQPRDNMQVIALQGFAGTLQDCAVCHGNAVPPGPGPHGLPNPNPTTTVTTSPTATRRRPRPLDAATRRNRRTCDGNGHTHTDAHRHADWAAGGQPGLSPADNQVAGRKLQVAGGK